MPLQVLEILGRGANFSPVMTEGLIVHSEQVSSVWLQRVSFVMYNFS